MGYDTLQAVFAQTVTKSDTTLLPVPSTGQPQDRNGVLLYVGGAGNLTVETVGGDTVTFNGLLAGAFIPVRVTKVKAATTATNILALY